MPMSAEDLDELRALLAVAKKRPMNFAICMGKKPEDTIFVLHRMKAPEILGRQAKKDGDTPKVTFGVVEVKGKKALLTCQSDIPAGIAKATKKFLTVNKMAMKITVLDAAGNLAEDDGEAEELDDEEGTVADVAEAADSDGGAEEQAATGEDAEPAPEIDRAALLKRLGTMREAIAALSPEAQGKLGEPFRKLVDLVKAEELGRAQAGADKLDAAIAMLAGAATPPQGQAADPQAQKLQQVAAATRARIEQVADEKPRGQLLAAMDRVDGHIKASEAEAALALVKKVNDILKSLPQAGAGGGSTEGSGDEADPAADAAKAEWESRFAALEATINEALSKGLVEKPDDLRKLRDWATGMAIDGQFAKALQALPRIEAILATAPEGGKSAFEAEVDPEVKPFAVARLRWSGARSTMMSEVRRLESEIIAAAAEDELLEEAAANVSSLMQNVERLDDRLGDKLDSIVNAKSGPDRDRLKGEARAVIGEYEAELSKPFFGDIDNNSGFASVAVASTARAALAEITRVLA